jgi:serine/threonine-protein kinase
MTLARAAEMTEGDEAMPASGKRQLTRDLDAIVRKALAKRPDDRYRSMDAMIADFEAYLDSRPVTARRAGPIYFASRFAWRWRYAVAGTVLAFVALSATTLSAVRQAQVAEREADRANSVADFLASLFKQSDPSVNNGDKLTANEILDRGAERIEKDMASQPEQLGRLLTVIGGVYSSMGNLARAEASLERAATILESAPSRDNYDLGHAWVRLAWVRNNQHRGSDAITVLDRAIPLLDPTVPRARAELIAAHTFSALAHHDLAQPDEERREYEAAIALIEQTSEQTASMAGVYTNFSTFLRDRGDLAAARRTVEKAIAIYQRTLGDDRFPTLFAKGNLVLTMIEERDYDAARPLMERTAQQLEKVFGEKSLQFGRAQRVLGVIAGKQHRFDEAETYFAQAEKIYATAPESNPADASAPIQSAAEMELDRNRFDAALSKFDRVLSMRQAAMPADHPDVAETLDGRSRALIGLGRYQEAQHDAEQALAIRRAKLSPDAAATVQTLYHIGLARYALGDTAGSKQVWDDALDRAPRAYRLDNPELAELQAEIANPRLPANTKF